MEPSEFRQRLAEVAPLVAAEVEDLDAFVAITTIATRFNFPRQIDPNELVHKTLDDVWAHIAAQRPQLT